MTIGGRSVATASNQFVCGATNHHQGTVINDVYFGNGVTNSSPVDYTYNGTGGNGSDIPGGSVSLAGGKGTGSGIGGNVNILVSDSGAAGSSVNSLRTVATFSPSGTFVYDSLNANSGVIIPNSVPASTTNTLYNVGGVLYFNGSGVNSDSGGR